MHQLFCGSVWCLHWFGVSCVYSTVSNRDLWGSCRFDDGGVLWQLHSRIFVSCRQHVPDCLHLPRWDVQSEWRGGLYPLRRWVVRCSVRVDNIDLLGSVSCGHVRVGDWAHYGCMQWQLHRWVRVSRGLLHRHNNLVWSGKL